jgi:hypothetical protein
MAIVIHIEAGDVLELDIAIGRLKGMLNGVKTGGLETVREDNMPVRYKAPEDQQEFDGEDQDTATAAAAPAPAAPPRKRRTKAEIDAEKAAAAGPASPAPAHAEPPKAAAPAPAKPAGDDPAFDAPRAELRSLIAELMGLGLKPEDVKAEFFTPIGVAKIPDMTLVQLSDALDKAKKLKKEKTGAAAVAEFA